MDELAKVNLPKEPDQVSLTGSRKKGRKKSDDEKWEQIASSIVADTKKAKENAEAERDAAETGEDLDTKKKGPMKDGTYRSALPLPENGRPDVFRNMSYKQLQAFAMGQGVNAKQRACDIVKALERCYFPFQNGEKSATSNKAVEERIEKKLAEEMAMVNTVKACREDPPPQKSKKFLDFAKLKKQTNLMKRSKAPDNSGSGSGSSGDIKNRKYSSSGFGYEENYMDQVRRNRNRGVAYKMPRSEDPTGTMSSRETDIIAFSGGHIRSAAITSDALEGDSTVAADPMMGRSQRRGPPQHQTQSHFRPSSHHDVGYYPPPQSSREAHHMPPDYDTGRRGHPQYPHSGSPYKYRPVPPIDMDYPARYKYRHLPSPLERGMNQPYASFEYDDQILPPPSHHPHGGYPGYGGAQYSFHHGSHRGVVVGHERSNSSSSTRESLGQEYSHTMDPGIRRYPMPPVDYEHYDDMYNMPMPPRYGAHIPPHHHEYIDDRPYHYRRIPPPGYGGGHPSLHEAPLSVGERDQPEERLSVEDGRVARRGSGGGRVRAPPAVDDERRQSIATSITGDMSVSATSEKVRYDERDERRIPPPPGGEGVDVRSQPPVSVRRSELSQGMIGHISHLGVVREREGVVGPDVVLERRGERNLSQDRDGRSLSAGSADNDKRYIRRSGRDAHYMDDFHG